MDFDLEKFVNEVSYTLEQGPESIPTARTRTSVRRTATDNGQSQDLDLDRDSSTGSDENLMYSAAKRRRLNYHRRDSSPSTSSDDDFVAQAEENTGEDDVPDFFHPSLDMTTALVSAEPRLPPNLLSIGPDLPADGSIDALLMYKERLDLIPTFYTFTVKSCLLPIRRVQNALVTLYFHHIHPMFPVVDEYYITELHRKYKGKEELMDPCDFSVYHAIMVAGFAHLSEAQICNTPYRSVLEGQEAQVEQLKARYWSQPASNPMILTQISLILSLWSPGWIGPQNNSYWLDQAFKHAISSKLWAPHPSPQTEPKTGHRKLLWWCCLIRDRVLALGMRRPHRIHKAPISCNGISENDYGLEARYPSYTDRESKKISILAFVWFCRLSKIMESIAVAQRKNKFSRDWNGEQDVATSEELEEVIRLDRELREWGDQFEIVIEEFKESDGIDPVVWVPISTLRIMLHSLRAGLYQPYLHLPISHPSLSGPGIDPLQRMKDGARQVASSVSDVMQNKRCDAIPTWLVAWVTLPVAIYHVTNRILPNSSPDQILMPFLAQLVRRSSGAQMVLMAVRTATRDQLEKIARAEYDSEFSTKSNLIGDESSGNGGEAYKGFQFVHSSLSKMYVNRSTEARLLASVAKQVDEALESNGCASVKAGGLFS